MSARGILASIAFLMLEVAAGVAFQYSILLMVFLVGGGFGCLGLAIYLERVKVRWLVTQWTGVIDTEDVQDQTVIYVDERIEIPAPPSQIRGLTDDEKVVLCGVTMEVLANHEHNDFWGIYEDIVEGKRVSNGLCTECGNPRNQIIHFNEQGMSDE